MHELSAKATGSGAGAQDLRSWRAARLRDAGLRPARADEVAGDSRYDLHELLGLTDRGCPAELAVRILAPLEAGQAPP